MSVDIFEGIVDNVRVGWFCWLCGVSLVTGATYGNLEINHLLGERRHFIVEAELVLADALRREYEVALSLLFFSSDDLVAWR